MFSVENIYMENRRRGIYTGKRERDIMKLSSYIVHRKSSLGFSIVAEFKRRSPSGFTNSRNTDLEEYVGSMLDLGVSGISVLTEPTFFGGSYEDIHRISRMNIPILDKDFINSRVMIESSYNAGADCILLIADFLDRATLKDLALYASGMGMESLVEFHEPSALGKIPELDDIIIGYNRRNLRTLSMEGRESEIIKDLEKRDNLRILESGLDPYNMRRDIIRSFDSFLIGEALLKKRKEESAA
ncbi:MAG: indole-3-glycerol-phosphate synthase [Candidatus Thermoplasmatota archaeon]|nr:indole-3-glycerol-phosphate synthase [Candidatus Thermoplasmatota archaeon]